jgi:3'-phosphoadenosine 5'-phosphosulfate sulfotransferase (PAPS reductase)/FAD synthetase
VILTSKYTNEDLRDMQQWGLDRKINVTTTRLIEWYKHYEGKCYVSFSGGKDSTVLADLTARVCKLFGYKLVLWFSDTGLEYPELKKHTKDYIEYIKHKYDIDAELIIDYPKDKNGKRITFKDVILNNGYPIISKTISRQIHDVKKLGKDCWAWRCFDGTEMGIYKMEKWKYVIDAPFKVSNKCCDIMKKTPAKHFTKQSGLTPIIGTMASESKQRKNNWIQNGCNAFEKGNPSSQPISFWTEQDVLKYIKDFNIPYASVYGDIIQDENGIYKTTGLSRTGCVFCGYGCHLEKEPNRFQRLKKTHPKLWEYCMKPVSEGGLGMKDVLEYIDVKIE